MTALYVNEPPEGSSFTRSWCLTAQAEAANEATVTLDVVVLHIREKATTATDEAHEATTGVVITLVSLEVIGQIVDATGQKSDLDLG
jgi:hypothetical protein